jgi:hypothetical protein
MPVEGVELMKGHDVEILLHDLLSEKMACFVKMKASV